MNKRIWTMPLGIVEQFAANDYIAACSYLFECNFSGRFYVGIETSGDGVFHDHTYWELTGCERGECTAAGDRVYGDSYTFVQCDEVHEIPTSESGYFTELMYLVEEVANDVYAEPIKALAYTPFNSANHASISAWSIADLEKSNNS